MCPKAPWFSDVLTHLCVGDSVNEQSSLRLSFGGGIWECHSLFILPQSGIGDRCPLVELKWVCLGQQLGVARSPSKSWHSQEESHPHGYKVARAHKSFVTEGRLGSWRHSPVVCLFVFPALNVVVCHPTFQISPLKSDPSTCCHVASCWTQAPQVPIVSWLQLTQ